LGFKQVVSYGKPYAFSTLFETEINMHLLSLSLSLTRLAEQNDRKVKRSKVLKRGEKREF